MRRSMHPHLPEGSPLARAADAPATAGAAPTAGAGDSLSATPSPSPSSPSPSPSSHRRSQAGPPLPPRLLREVGRTIVEHRLIEDGDRILVAMSGGKDSYGLLVLLRDLQRRAPVAFDLIAVHLDQGHPGYDGAPLRAWLESEGVPFRILSEDTYSIVTEKIPEGKTYCSLCSRLRRGVLYQAATDLGCTKIALGHHREDALETLLLNLFFSGKLSAMPPRLVSDDGRHVVIRPLITCAEADLAALAVERKFPILPCNLCGSQSEAQRKQMKALIATLEAKHPTLRSSMLAALGNVVPSHLMDARLSAQVAAGRAALASSSEPNRTMRPSPSLSPSPSPSAPAAEPPPPVASALLPVSSLWPRSS